MKTDFPQHASNFAVLTAFFGMSYYLHAHPCLMRYMVIGCTSQGSSYTCVSFPTKVLYFRLSLVVPSIGV